SNSPSAPSRHFRSASAAEAKNSQNAVLRKTTKFKSPKGAPSYQPRAAPWERMPYQLLALKGRTIPLRGADFQSAGSPEIQMCSAPSHEIVPHASQHLEDSLAPPQSRRDDRK